MAAIRPNTAPKSIRLCIDHSTNDIHRKIIHSFYQLRLQIMVTPVHVL